jgi:hypothetical protein
VVQLKLGMEHQTHRRSANFEVLRIILSLMGAPFHVAVCLLGTIELRWWVHDVGQPFFAYAWVSHLFRMQTFMVIAGFYFPVALRRNSTGRAIWLRFRRLMVPVLLIYPFVPVIVWAWYEQRSWVRRQLYWPVNSEYIVSQIYGVFTGQTHLHYLWFLIDLFLYSCLFALAAHGFRKAGGRRLAIAEWGPWKVGAAFAAFVGAVALAVAANDPWVNIGFPSTESFVGHLLFRGSDQFYFLLFFLAGTFFAANPFVREARWHRSFLLVGFGCVATLLVLALGFPELRFPGAAPLPVRLLTALGSCGISFGLFGWFQALSHGGSKFERALSPACFWYNLSHYPVAIFAALALNVVDLSFSTRFWIATAVTVAVPLLLYQAGGFLKSSWQRTAA